MQVLFFCLLFCLFSCFFALQKSKQKRQKSKQKGKKKSHFAFTKQNKGYKPKQKRDEGGGFFFLLRLFRLVLPIFSAPPIKDSGDADTIKDCGKRGEEAEEKAEAGFASPSFPAPPIKDWGYASTQSKIVGRNKENKEAKTTKSQYLKMEKRKY